MWGEMRLSRAVDETRPALLLESLQPSEEPNAGARDSLKDLFGAQPAEKEFDSFLTPGEFFFVPTASFEGSMGSRNVTHVVRQT